jgi:gas vesicle protein
MIRRVEVDWQAQRLLRPLGSRLPGCFNERGERMKRVMVLIVAFMFCFTASVFAQSPAKKGVKETVKEDVKAVKKDATKMKEGIKADVKEQVGQAKESAQEVKEAVKENVTKAKEATTKGAKKVKKAVTKDAPAEAKK